MAAKRKLWKVTTRLDTSRPESEVKAYDYVKNELANWLCRPLAHREATRFVTVWVDERDGAGWRKFEVVDLAELAMSER